MNYSCIPVPWVWPIYRPGLTNLGQEDLASRVQQRSRTSLCTLMRGSLMHITMSLQHGPPNRLRSMKNRSKIRKMRTIFSMKHPNQFKTSLMRCKKKGSWLGHVSRKASSSDLGLCIISMRLSVSSIAWLRSMDIGDFGIRISLMPGGIAFYLWSKSSLTLFTQTHHERLPAMSFYLTWSFHRGSKHQEELVS